MSLALRVLDHQVEGRDTEMLGNVDDVALEEREGQLVAVGILRGPIAWSLRQPGLLGAWGRAVARRLDPREDARPLVVPLDHVLAIGSAVHVDGWAERLLADTDGMELWLREHLIARIPGARGGEHAFGGAPGQGPRSDPELELSRTAHLLSSLLGAPVVAPDGSDAGRVLEVRAEQVTPLDSRVGPLVVTSLVHGHRGLGSRLGYADDPRMGPWVVGAVLRRLHRHDEESAWADVAAVDWAGPRVLLRKGPGG